MADSPIITITTDFGYEDAFVGVMKGVVLRINPSAKIVDLTHGIRPQNIREAAFTIGTSYAFFPANTIHVVVVDPGVGSKRRPVIVSTDHHYFIGPDNGVFSYIYRKSPEAVEVVHITSNHYFLSSHSPTFQGRDVFAPVAAWFSKGIGMSKFGERITDYNKIDLPFPKLTAEGVLKGEVTHVDRFGNAITNIKKVDIEQICGLKPDGTLKILLKDEKIPLRKFYSEAEPDKLCSLINSSEHLEFFIYKGSASAKYNISEGDAVEIVLI